MQAVQQIPGNNYEFTQPVQMRMNELIAGVRSDVAVKLFGDDLDQLLESGGAVEEVVASVSGAEDVKIEQVTGLPVLAVTPKRDMLARYGISMAEVQDAVATATGGRKAGEVFEGDRRFAVVVRLPEALRTDLPALGNLPVRLAAGGTLPLSQLADISLSAGPNQISRENGKRRAALIDTVTLVNLVSDTRVVPEFIGDRCTPALIAPAPAKAGDADCPGRCRHRRA